MRYRDRGALGACWRFVTPAFLRPRSGLDHVDLQLITLTALTSSQNMRIFLVTVALTYISQVKIHNGAFG